MVKLTKIYTGKGDKGDTSLGDNSRLWKDDIRIEAIGSVDEANSFIGLVITRSADSQIVQVLTRIQNDLFDLGADLCFPEESTKKQFSLKKSQSQWLKTQINKYQQQTSHISSFVLPSTNEYVALLHIARTVVRRAERRTTTLSQREDVNMIVLQYLNRLSDLLFIIGRLDFTTDKEKLWQIGLYQ